MAARAVLAGVARVTPKSGEGEVEMIRMLKITKDSAVKARTQAMNQMQALIITAPATLRATLHGLTPVNLVARCARLRPGKLTTPTAAAKRALQILARRCHYLTIEIDALEKEMAQLVAQTAPVLLQLFGVGPNTAATLIITAGSNPGRLKSEAAFAALCGVSPLPASSGRTNRHRLNRGGDRQANAPLYRIVIVRLQYDSRTKAYMKRRTGEGMTKTEIIRCLKRYVAREVYSILHEMGQQNVANET
jgi:transposase